MSVPWLGMRLPGLWTAIHSPRSGKSTRRAPSSSAAGSTTVMASTSSGLGDRRPEPGARWVRNRTVCRPNKAPMATRRNSSPRGTAQPAWRAAVTSGSRSRRAPAVAAAAAATASAQRSAAGPGRRRDDAPLAMRPRSRSSRPTTTACTNMAPGRPNRAIASCDNGNPAPLRARMPSPMRRSGRSPPRGRPSSPASVPFGGSSPRNAATSFLKRAPWAGWPIPS